MTSAKGPDAEPKRLRRRRRVLDVWEQYRVLREIVDDGQYLEDLADHKVRFGALLLGGVNAAVLLLATGADLPSRLSPQARLVVTILLIPYVLVGLGVLVQAVETLRPRRNAPPAGGAAAIEPARLRRFDDVAELSREAHRQAWIEATAGAVVADLADRVYELATINAAKYRALTRLYVGLRISIGLSALLLGAVLVALAGSG